MAEAALELTGVSKRFGAVQALDGVSLTVRRGEVHGLVGANGSGKSTLVKILAGYHAPAAGSVRIWGAEVPCPITDASRHGIATIHQDLGLIEELSVTENIIGTTGFGTSGARPIAWRRQHARVGRLLAELGIDIDPRALVGDIGRGQRTLVAVARAILEMDDGRGAHLLITDEPTSALSASEAGALWDLLRRVTARGGAALFISHHLQEVRERCDGVTVLRNGRVAAVGDCPDTTESQLVEWMLGEAGRATRERATRRPRRAAADAPAPAPVLALEDLRGRTVAGVSFEVAPGEIVGITGLLGMGQDELPALIAGHRMPTGGTVQVDGRALPPGDPMAALAAGVVLVPADRHAHGLWTDGSVAENLGLVASRRFWSRGHYNRRLERRVAAELSDRFGVHPRDPELHVNALSGGNQQKVLIAKWLQLEPRLVLLHEPTQGVDVGAKAEIHRLIDEFVERTAAAVCVFSSDLEETAHMCDRVLVLSGGRLAGALGRDDLTPQRILEAANAA